MMNKLIDKLLTSNSLFFILYFFITVVVLCFVLVSLHTGIPFETFIIDPLAMANLKPYTGFLSNLGVIAWSFAAGICFFSCVLIRDRKADHQLFFFLFFSSILSAILLVDDLYLFHERIGPALFGISEKGIFSIYAVLTLTYLIYFRRLILHKTNFYLLALSLMLFGASVIIDSLNLFKNEWNYAYEDIPKIFGIFTWLAYHFSSCQRALTR